MIDVFINGRAHRLDEDYVLTREQVFKLAIGTKCKADVKLEDVEITIYVPGTSRKPMPERIIVHTNFDIRVNIK